MDKKKETLFSKKMTRAEALRSLAAGAVAGTLGLGACREGAKSSSTEVISPSDDKVSLRRNPKNGDKVSLLGFGCMRFPTIGGDRYTGEIDREATKQMIDYAMAHGVNYYDTAWMYHKGKSEEMMGEALAKYPRESYFLADKMPPSATSLADAKEIFATQLKRCRVEYFDYYLCHSISRRYKFQELYLDEGVLDYLLEEKRKGRIRQLGFSFHGDMALYDWLLDLPIEWDFVQIQMNWLEWRDQSRLAEVLYNKLAERKIPVIVMEPIRGGALINLPYAVKDMLTRVDPSLTTAAWALKFCASYPYVLSVLSGMTKMEHVVENCQTLSNFKPLSDEHIDVLMRAAELYRNNTRIDCTDCLYCMPCPYGVDIAGIMRVYNRCAEEQILPDPTGEKDEEYLRRRRIFLNRYKNNIKLTARAEHCIGCKECNPKCPQSLDIPVELKRVEDLVELLYKEWR